MTAAPPARTPDPRPEHDGPAEVAAPVADGDAKPEELHGASLLLRLFRLALPIMGLNTLNVLALAVDTAMCGHLENPESVLAALSFATQLVFLLMVAMLGLSVGTVSLVSRAYGAGDMERVEHLLVQSTLLTFIVSALVATVGNAFADPLMRLLGADDTTAELGLAYLRPMLVGTIFSYTTLLYASTLRGVGTMVWPFVAALISNGLNVLFNTGLILGKFGCPALGVQGAAYGTLLSQAIGLVFIVTILRRGVVPGIRPTLRLEAIDRPLARELFFVGAPAALDMIVVNIAFLSLVGMLGRISDAAVGAHGVGLRIQSIAFMPGLGIAQATASLVGQALGAGDIPRARRTVFAGLCVATTIMVAISLTITSTVEPILAIFNVQPATEQGALAELWIILLAIGMPFAGVYTTFVGMLQGAGTTRISLAINATATLALQIPLSILLGFQLGLGAFGIWAAFPLAVALKAVGGRLVFRSKMWEITGVHAG